ncbi:MAG TPA: DUF2142 domain-containing protein [Allosphingosinicella sp.]|nr:DUF2142 domain-containing protein [Allosphingosinicella sp.]
MTIVPGGDAASLDGAGPSFRTDLPALRRILLIAGGLLYLAYALITPPFQTTDEHQHLFRAWQLAHFQLHGERRGGEAGGMLPTGLPAAAAAELGSIAPNAIRPVPKRPLASLFARSTPVAHAQPRVFANFPGGVLYSPAGYGPQIVAVRTGEVLGLSVENIVRLGRLLNAALTLGLFLLALNILPVGRLFLLLAALTPMTACAAASLGQDGLIIGSSAILIALGVRARFEGRWTRRALLLLALFAAIVGLSKIVYLPLVGLALLPLPRSARPLPWLGWPVLIGLGGAALSALWLHSNAGIVVPPGSGLADPTAQLAFLAAHPFAFPAALGNAFVHRSLPIFFSTFTFGWVTVGPVTSAAFLALAAFAFAFRHGEAAAETLTRGWRLWAGLIWLIAVLGIAAALYLVSTPLGAPVVEGIQGRYFLPLLPLFCLVFIRRRPAASGTPARFAIIAMLAANFAALAAIGAAFYSF